MTQLTFLLLSSILFFANALELPFVPAQAQAHTSVAKPGRWWAQVGDRVYYNPPASFLGLSQNISDYYYVMGSKSAIPDKMRDHVVGSQGRWHIMHLPSGPAMLEISSHNGDRRSALSKFSRLRSGTVLSVGFPSYEPSSDYVHPLDEEGQALEKAAVADITPELTMDYLTKLTQFPTRSYNNAAESDKVEHYLKQQFEAVGMHTCYHNFNGAGQTLTNVIAHIPGTLPGSLTIGAHYDSRPFDGKAPGAEDNGSGVAALLAIAKAFNMNKVVPKRSVFFAAFAGEEPGLLGSRHFAQALKSESLPAECTANSAASLIQNVARKRRAKDLNAEHRAIIMDEIGWASPKLGKHTVNLESYDELGRVVMQHLRHATDMHNGDDLDVVHNAAPFGSDHMPFLDQGFAAALTINGDDEAYPHYHQSSDTISNVSPELMSKIAKMNIAGLMRLSMA